MKMFKFARLMIVILGTIISLLSSSHSMAANAYCVGNVNTVNYAYKTWAETKKCAANAVDSNLLRCTPQVYMGTCTVDKLSSADPIDCVCLRAPKVSTSWERKGHQLKMMFKPAPPLAPPAPDVGD